MVTENMIKLQQRLTEPFTGMQNMKILKELSALVRDELFTIYDKQYDREKWLSREILSFTNNITIFDDQNELFNEVYRNTYSRFEFIVDYLRHEEFKYDLTRLMIDEFDNIAINKYKFDFIRFTAGFVYNLKKDSIIIELLIKLIDFYYKNQDYIDRTTVSELQGFIFARFGEEELENIKNENILITNFMLED